MRLALVTGGSKGLGFALCETLAERGYRVVEFSRSAPHAFSVCTDLAAPEACRLIVLKEISSFGDERIEELLVVSNAATLEPIGPASRKARDAIVANLNTNITSAILILTEIMAQFQATACRKVLANITAGAAQTGVAGWSLYCAAKAAMENYIRALAVEQQSEPHPFIPINIDPGVMDTQMQALVRACSPSDFPAVERFVNRKNEGALASPGTAAVATYRILQLSSLSYGERYDVRDQGG